MSILTLYIVVAHISTYFTLSQKGLVLASVSLRIPRQKSRNTFATDTAAGQSTVVSSYVVTVIDSTCNFSLVVYLHHVVGGYNFVRAKLVETGRENPVVLKKSSHTFRIINYYTTLFCCCILVAWNQNNVSCVGKY